MDASIDVGYSKKALTTQTNPFSHTGIQNPTLRLTHYNHH